MQLNQKQEAEVQFWNHLCTTETAEQFLRRRRSDFYNNIVHYAGWCDLSGAGLEVGTGCYSQLEWAKARRIYSIDPLNDVYDSFLKVHNSSVDVGTYDGENLPFEDGVFDWVVNWNVIDHTPDPKKMADECFRVLKPGGKLYFEVNFDDYLAAPHYALWTQATVDSHLPVALRIFENAVRVDADRQTRYYAVYQKGAE